MAEPPCLLALRGLPGSGKSTLARALSRRFGWSLIDKDDVKDIIDGHTDEAGWLSYTVMLRLVERQLAQGLSVVCDSPLTYARVYDELSSAARKHGAALLVIACRCGDEAVWRARIDGRKALGLPSHHQTDWTAWQAQRPAWDTSMAYAIEAPLLTLDTFAPPAICLDTACEWIVARRGEAR